MKDTTLCILVKEKEILLGLKKAKIGKGKYNGFGGHVEPGESIEQAALRELKEETRGVIAVEFEKVAEIEYSFDVKKEWDQRMHVYLVKKWDGHPVETEEMTCQWFSKDNIPYNLMWDNDKYWLPLVLAGKRIRGVVYHSEDKTLNQTIREVNKF